MLVFLVLSVLVPLALAQSSSTAPLPNPTAITCPSNLTLVRSAGTSTTSNQTLSAGESAYISSRAASVLPNAWKSYLQTVNALSSSSPLPSYVSNLLTNTSTLPKLGIAVSGGGYRAALFGAGALSSLDGRNTTAVNATGTGGLLQAASYIAGLSGGSWLITALSQANFPSVSQLANGVGAYGGFLAQVDLTVPGPGVEGTLAYLEMLIAESKAKQVSSGLPITVTDPWSRSLARHFTNGTTAQDILSNGTHGAGILLSGLPDLPSFQAHEQPFPIVIVDSIPPNPNASATLPQETVPLTSEIWEFNVFESGSWDPSLASFIPTSLLGSTNSSHCMAGLDQLSYIAGMSSNIFNEFNLSASILQSSPVGPLIQLLQSAFPSEGVRLDSAAVPNPFKGVNPSTFSASNEDFLTFVDGGSDGEVLPLQPLLVRARGVDTILAIDAAADMVDNFTNGTDLITAAERASLFGAQYPFPSVPASATTIVQEGLNRRPTFFGCNDTSTALIVYIANGGPPANGASPVTNTSTAQSTYSLEEVQAFIDQAFQIATQGINGTQPSWGTCLACAVVDRARARAGVQREGVCATCFAAYCWDGVGAAVGGNSTGTPGLGGAGAGAGAGAGKSNGGKRRGGSAGGGMMRGVGVGVVVAVVVAYVV